MSAKVALLTILVATIFTICLSSCGPGSELPRGPDATWDLVIIGDSSLWKLGPAFASQIERDVGVQVTVHDFSLPSLSAGEVLQVLRTGESARFHQMEQLPGALAAAEVVVMFVNPVHSVDPARPHEFSGYFGARPPGPCGPETLEQWTMDLKDIWEHIFSLRDGRPIILRGTDLYNPLVVPWTEQGVFEACTECWENLSIAARQASDAYGIPFLSRLDAFNGPSHREDPRERGFILSDGEIPSLLAARFTAELLGEMGYEPVPEP